MPGPKEYCSRPAIPRFQPSEGVMNKATATATLGLAVAATGLAHAGTLEQPGYFLDGSKNPTLLAAIRQGMNPKISFNDHYSTAKVSCGPGCDSYWFVDRQTGGVLEVPESPQASEMVWDVRSRANSDSIAVTYGPRDGVPSNCSTRHFQWVAKAFVALDNPAPVNCPG